MRSEVLYPVIVRPQREEVSFADEFGKELEFGVILTIEIGDGALRVMSGQEINEFDHVISNQCSSSRPVLEE